MKRFLSALLIVCILLSFAACGKADTSSDKNGIDIEYYAELGSMPESKYSLGQDIDTLKQELEEIYNTEEEAVYNVVEGKSTVQIDSGAFQYYYVKENESDGISYIVNFNKAFGFEIGTVSVEISDALKEFKSVEEDLNDDNAFFVLGNQDGKVLKYKFSKNTVSFVFVNDALYATAIYKTNDWE